VTERRLGCPVCRFPQLVFAEHGLVVDCAWCAAGLVVQADVVGHSLREREPIVSAEDIELALAHLRPEDTDARHEHR
jgi:hypothetical protein